MRPATPNPPEPTDSWILGQRGPRNILDPHRPYASLVEPEHTKEGLLEDVATIFLTNRECPFRCLVCDLWKNTTVEQVPDGAIAEQIEWALAQLPTAKHIKLYNAGSFFDPKAIPKADWPGIVRLVRSFSTVIVEAHPKLIDHRCFEFAEWLADGRSGEHGEKGKLQVAMGLETVDPDVLPRLNKHMTLDDFSRATQQLLEHDIDVRAFILLRTPFQTEAEGVTWAKRSIDFAFEHDVECCIVIPTRVGNGAMESLQADGHFEPPTLRSLENVMEYGLSLKQGRVFVDLWDIEGTYRCPDCDAKRAERLRKMNRIQQSLPRVSCHKCGDDGDS